MATVQEVLDRYKTSQDAYKKSTQLTPSGALQKYKRYLKDNSSTALKGIYDSLNAEYKYATELGMPSWGKGSEAKATEAVKKNQETVAKLKGELDIYKDYIDKDTYDSFSKSIASLETGYSNYINNAKIMEHFDSEDIYKQWYERESFINDYIANPEKAMTSYSYQPEWLSTAMNRKVTHDAVNDPEYDRYVNAGLSIKNPNPSNAPIISGIGAYDLNSGKGGMLRWDNVNNKATYARWAKVHGINRVLMDNEYLRYAMMNDDEVKTYSYYLAKYGEDKAEEYFDSIAPDINNRMAGIYTNSLDDIGASINSVTRAIYPSAPDATEAIKAIYGFATGLEQYKTGMINLFDGEDYYDPSALSISGQNVRESLSKPYQVGYDVINSIGNMFPSLMLSAIPVVGGAVSMASMGMSAAGNAKAEFINAGYSEGEALGYGALIGISEAVLQKVLGGIKFGGKGAGGLFQNLASKWIPSIKNAAARVAVQVGANAADEALEEGIQTLLEPVFKKMITGEWDGIDWKEALYSAMLGAITGGVIEGSQTVATTGIESFRAADIYGNKQQQLVSDALAVSPDSTHAKWAQSKLDQGKSLSGYQLNRLVTDTQEAIRTKDATKISNSAKARLVELGEVWNADQVSKAIAKTLMGEKLTISDKLALKESKNAYQVLTEADPENVASGNLKNKWAEEIGTIETNATAYNLAAIVDAVKQAVDKINNAPTPKNATEAKTEASEKVQNKGGISNSDVQSVEVHGDDATFKLADGTTVSRGAFNFSSNYADTVADAAVEKVSRVKGFTNEAATAMIKGYDDSISPMKYINAFGEAFALGAKGIGFSEVRHVLNKNAISEKTARVAYLLGQQSAENSKNGLKNESENGTINKEKSEGKNESTESVRLRNGSKRNGSKNSEGSLRSVESGTGKAESRGEVRRIADSEAAALLNEGREVTVADLGIRGGSSEATVRVFSKSQETAKMKKARKAAEARGLKIKFIAGDNMLISEENGTHSAINGYILGDNIIVRVDHPLYTADQITRHEIGHDMVAKGEVDINKVRERLAKMLDPEDYQAVAEAYADAYRGTNLDADAIFEELICDSLGDMNIFAELNAATAAMLDSILPEIKKAASESKAPTKTRGSPTSKAVYNKRDGKDGWGKVYGTAQEALNDAIKSVDTELWNAFNEEIDSEKAHTPITNAIIAVQQDVRQDTITPIQGAKLLSEGFNKGGAKAMDTIYNHATGNLIPAAIEKAKKYSTVADVDVKASRETYSKHDKALYTAGVSFLHKNFPPENERLSEAHRLATWWARNENTVSGDQTLIFMNDICYLVECFDDALNYYQVEDVVSKAEFDTIYKEIKQYGRSGQIKSIQGSFDWYDQLNKSSDTTNSGESSVNSHKTRHGEENSSMVRVAAPKNNGRERSSSNGSRNSQSSSEDRQKYSRELDTSDYSHILDLKTEVNSIRKSIKEIESSDDFKAQMDKLSEAVANDDVVNGVKAYEEWKSTSGYGELVAKRDNLESQISKLSKEYEDNRVNLELKAEKEAIEKSGLREADYFRKQAVKEFGYTPHFYDAGYILPNGKMLNFSGEKGKHFGSRGQDHRAIGTIYANTHGTDALVRFMNDGNIRIMAESPGLDISSNSEPTKEQYSTIRSFIYEYANQEYFNIDLSDERGNVIGSLEYEGRINPTRIINDVKHYYETGEIREQSDVDKFRYSRELDFIDFINEQAGEESDPNLTKTQNVAKVRGELERMNVGKGEIMAVTKVADKMFDVYGGESSISDFRYGMLEATKLALDGTDKGFDAAYEILHTLAKEVAYNPKNVAGEAALLAEIKNYIRGSKISVHEADKTSGEFDRYGGYGEFRKRLFGKVNLANDGVQADVLYDELHNLYGDAFFPTLNTVSEQLMQMEKLMNTPLSDYMMVSDEELNASADEMVISLFDELGNIWNKAIKTGKPIVAVGENDKISNRSLLANALENAAQNDIERGKLEQYKAKIDLINAEEQKLLELRIKIKELSFAKGQRDTEAIKSLQLEANQAANRINTYDRQLLNLESTKALKGVLEREKAMLRKKLIQEAAQSRKEALARAKEAAERREAALKADYQAAKARGIESRNKTAMRHSIISVVGDLNKLLLHESKERNIKEGLKAAVALALEAVNLDTVSADARIAKLEEELLKAGAAQNLDKVAEIQHKIDYVRKLGDSMKDKLTALKSAYEEIASSADSSNQFKEEAALINTKVQSTIEKVGDTPLRDMTLSQLESVHDLYKMVLTTVRDANKLWRQGKQEDLQQYAKSIEDEIAKLGKSPAEVTVIREWFRKFKWNEMIPYYFFENIGSETLAKLFYDFIEAQNTYAVDLDEAQLFAAKTRAKYGYKKWKLDEVHSFKLNDGRTFDTTLKHLLSIYAYSKRDQALDHMSVGGFFHNDKATFRKKGGVFELVRTDTEGYRVDAKTLFEIQNALTDEQKAYVEEMQDYLTKMGEKGNEVTRVLWGIDLFKEKVYFPLKSKDDFLKKSNETAQAVALKNDGMTKEVKPGASNPIVLEAFDDVWASHINRMSQYHAFVLPIDNMNKVSQYGTWANNEASSTVSTKIKGIYGTAATDYLQQFIKDMNGNVVAQGVTNPIAGMFNKFKKTAVAASLSVIIQQPTAIARAIAEIDPRYFVGNPKFSWDEIRKYAPIAIIKDIGGFDAGSGVRAEKWLNKGAETGISKVTSAIDEYAMKGAEMADRLGWGNIWNAVKRETAHNNPTLNTNSEEFLKLCGKRFTEVIVKTQVYDSTLSRSAFMRSKHDIVKMLTSFMGEPTVAMNMLYNGVVTMLRGKSKAAIAKGARMIAAVYLASVLGAAFKSLISALNDDDVDESYWEKYMQSLGNNVLGEVVFLPASSLPVFRDVVSIIQGYDVERGDLSVFKDVYDAFSSLGSDSKGTYKKVEDLAGSIAALFGIPAKNLLRTGRQIYNLGKTIFDDISGGNLGKSFVEGFTNKKRGVSEKIYDAILDGDDARLDVLLEGKSRSEIASAYRKALRENDPRIKEAAEAKADGNFERYESIALSIELEGHFDRDDIKAAITSEFNEMTKVDTPSNETVDKDEAVSWYNTADIHIAFEKGDNALAKEIIADIINTKVANGKTEKEAKSSIRSSMTSYWKPLYISAHDSKNYEEKARIKKILIDSGFYGGKYAVGEILRDWLKN